MSEKIKTAVMEIIKAHMDGEDKNAKAVLSDIMESVRETLEQEQRDCSTCKYEEYSSNYQPCRDCGTLLESYTKWEQKDSVMESEQIAQERYKDLCEYFGDAKDILKSREDFKAWLERVKWHIRKAEELYKKYEYKKEPCEKCEVEQDLCKNCLFGEGTEYCRKRCPYESKTEQEPCDDAVSREAVKKWVCKTCPDDAECQRDCDVIKGIDAIPSVNPQYTGNEFFNFDAPIVKKSMEQDVISREAVETLIDELARAISDERCCVSRGRSTATIMRDILHLPSVTPSRRKGHWEFYGRLLKCSECGKIWDDMEKECPNCSIEMEIK